MKPMRIFVLTVLLAPLAACAIAQSDATATNSTGGTCRPQPLAQFVGQPSSQELGARILAASGARVIRWVPKGGVVTMEYREDRVTVQLDGSNRVERANCG
jgi:hypothetical protein